MSVFRRRAVTPKSTWRRSPWLIISLGLRLGFRGGLLVSKEEKEGMEAIMVTSGWNQVV